MSCGAAKVKLHGEGDDCRWELVDPLLCPHWDDQVISTGDYSFFHSTAWARVLYESYGYHPYYFTVSSDNTLQGVLPFVDVQSLFTGRRGVSLSFTDFCEPISTDAHQFRHLFAHVVGYGKRHGWRFVELKGGKRFLGDAPPSAVYLVHTLDLCADEQQQLATLRSSTRRNINKSMSSGVQVRIDSSYRGVQEFQKLNCLTRKRHGLPPQPHHFFEKVYDHVISKNHGFVVIASHDDRSIAAGMYFHFGDTALYKYGASDETYQQLRGNNLVMWEAIRWYCRNGFKTFSFGRTDPDNEGLRQFKSGWGGREETIEYYRYNMEKEAFVAGKPELARSYARIFEKLPLPLLKALGTVLYRHMG